MSKLKDKLEAYTQCCPDNRVNSASVDHKHALSMESRCNSNGRYVNTSNECVTGNIWWHFWFNIYPDRRTQKEKSISRLLSGMLVHNYSLVVCIKVCSMKMMRIMIMVNSSLWSSSLSILFDRRTLLWLFHCLTLLCRGHLPWQLVHGPVSRSRWEAQLQIPFSSPAAWEVPSWTTRL